MPNARVPIPAPGALPELPPRATEPVPQPPVVQSPGGQAWHVHDCTSGLNGGRDWHWHAAPHPEAHGRAFVAMRGGQKLVRVIERRPDHGTTAWCDVSDDVLAAQLRQSVVPEAGWTDRVARRRHAPRHYPA